MLKQPLACRGWTKVLRTAIEQFGAGLSFQLLNASGNGWLTHAQQTGGFNRRMGECCRQKNT